jgi:signal peptide peptidase SppA
MSNFFNHFIAIATSVLHLVLVLTEVLGAVAVLVMMVLICKSIFKALGHAADKDKAETKKTCALEHVHESTMFALRKRLDGGIACGSPVAAGQSNAGAKCQKLAAVITFDGDVMATGRQGFAELVDEAIRNKERLSEVVVVVSSPGGGVAEYGQMNSEMERLRRAGLNLTACVDTYAASGGYLMSVPAHRIIAAPFAMVGSIGVVSEFLNFSELLNTLGVKAMTMTAGKYKRTLTQFGDVTEEGKEKFLEGLKAIHRQFIKAVTTYRVVDADAVCTGDHWTAAESMELNLNLVDELATSQEYLFRLNQSQDLVVLSKKSNRFEKGIFRFLTRLADHCMDRVADRIAGGMHL